MPANLENSSGHRTGKGQFSFQSQRKAIPKNAQTTAQLHSSHTLVMLKILQARLQQYVNHELPDIQARLQQYVNYELPDIQAGFKAEEPEVKLPTSVGSLKKQEKSRKTSTSALLTMPKPLTVWITTNHGKFLKRWVIPDHLTCLLRNLNAGQEATVRTGHRTDWLQIGKGVCQGCILSPSLFNLYTEYILKNAGLDEA